MTTKLTYSVLIGLIQAQAAGTFQNAVGIYHWAGEYPVTVSEGVRQIAALGGRIARIALSARSYQDYQMAQNCHENFALGSFVQEPDIKAALDNPAIEVYVLTVYDGTSFSDCIHQNFLVPSFYSEEQQKNIVREYSDLTLYLYQAYKNTSKRFVLSNWESDNTIYCGQAYRYALDGAFRTYCNAMYPQWYGGNRNPDDSFVGLKLWFELRQQGVAAGRERAAALGLGGMRVYLAPEFCIVKSLHDNGFKSVLYDILPFVMFDYVSYSAYESINNINPGNSLIADLNTISSIIGSTAVIIGESGFSRSQWGEAAVSRTDDVINAALSWGAPYVIQWELYDQSTSTSFGLLSRDGSTTPTGAYFQRNFQASSVSRSAGGGLW